MFPIMKTDHLTYLFYLMYFRSSRCDQVINWKHLGLDVDLGYVDVKMPHQTAAVTRTFGIAISYLILNVFLSLAAVASLREYQANSCTGRNKW